MKEVLQKRLKNHIKKEKLVQAKLEQEKRMNEVHFYCVIDFEGTCEEENPKDYIHEIIEFPAVLVDATTLEVVSEISRGTEQLSPIKHPIGEAIYIFYSLRVAKNIPFMYYFRSLSYIFHTLSFLKFNFSYFSPQVKVYFVQKSNIKFSHLTKVF